MAADNDSSAQTIVKVSPVPRFMHLVGQAGLYKEVAFDQDELEAVTLAVGTAGINIDLHCPICGESSTFQMQPVLVDALGNVLDPDKAHPSMYVAPHPPSPISTYEQLESACRAMKFRCARSKLHIVEFILRIRREQTGTYTKNEPVLAGGRAQRSISIPRYRYMVFKIGQQPPHAALVAGKLKALSKVADPLDYEELRRAAGLISHDAAIGAFIYLRRVFERIIEKAMQAAVENGEALPDFSTYKMRDKITALRAHLPSIVVTNASVYGILSLGVHELTEKDCAAAYPIVETSVIAMLEDAHALREKAKRDQQLKLDITRLNTQLKQ